MKQQKTRRLQGMVRFASRMVKGTIRASPDILPEEPNNHGITEDWAIMAGPQGSGLEASGSTTVILGTIRKSY